MSEVSTAFKIYESKGDRDLLEGGLLNMVSGYKELPLAKMEKANTPERFRTDYKRRVFPPETGEEQKSLSSLDELKEMKELLLIHLDFIQQQSEQLTSKDGQINDLKRENEMLKRRIGLNERLLSILNKSRDSTVENGEAGGRGESGSGLKRRRRQSEESTSSREKYKSYQNDRGSDTDVKKSKTEVELEVNESQQLVTEDKYWTIVGERIHKLLPEPQSVPAPKDPSLEVPQWRKKIYTWNYTMEGTEDLSDDVFKRRHCRLEYDERRRKKWDVQRLREQRQMEKLAAGRSRGKEEEDGNPALQETLLTYPDPKLLTLFIQPLVPVSAFGLPVPDVAENIDFSLPWLTGKEMLTRSRSFTGKGKR